MYDPFDAFATTERDHDDDTDRDLVDELDVELEDSDVIDDVDTDAMAAAGFTSAFVAAALEPSRLVKLKQRALVRWQRPATRWVALAIAIAVILAGGGTWSILDTRAKEAAAAEAALTAAQAAHTTALRNTDALADTADEVAAAAEPFGLEAERTTLTETIQALRADVDGHRNPGTVTDDIRTHTSKIYPLATPVREALDGVLASVDAATTAKLDGAPLVSDDDKAPTIEAMGAVTEAFGTLTEVPAALTALAAAHAELQGKQDAAQAAAEAEAARVAAEEAAAAAAAEQAARAAGGSSAGQGAGGNAGARPGTGNSGRPGTGGGGTRPGTGGGTGGGANPGTGGGGGGTAPGTGGGNSGGGGTGPAPYSSADAASAVRARFGGSAPLTSCVQMNSGSFSPGSMISPAWNPATDGGRLGWKAWAEGGLGYVVFYACD